MIETQLHDSVESHPETIITSSFAGLRSVKSTHKLNQIDRVRATGVGDHISLPQLVVCGDQSAGKSSVLEGISGIPFPRQDGVCTKFATEIILRHDPLASRITATIIPHGLHSEKDKENLLAYRRELADFLELPSVISDASTLMKIRGHNGVQLGPAFSADVLRIEVVGDTGLHLTVVDLPGLIAVTSDEQTDEDVEMVAKLVDKYLESSRTIILAVIQATNDIANQKIIQRARKFDKAGQRTVGIITKADLINKHTESRIALLAKNKDTTKLRLGYFLLKNPTPAQLNAGMSADERKQDEYQFFSSGPWSEQKLDMSRVGIEALRNFLQELLEQHIERELPKVKTEIKKLLSQSETELAGLGDERPSATHLRMFLTRLSMSFHDLAQAGLDGNYQTMSFSFFNDFDELENPTRLRAEIHRLNGKFATNMRVNSQKRKIIESSEQQITDHFGNSSSSDLSSDSENGQLLVDRDTFDAWVKQVYVRTRGRELPGNYNHVLLSELFHEQSSRWAQIASDHVSDVSEKTKVFVERALLHVIAEDKVRGEVQQFTAGKLESRKKNAHSELQRIISDERLQPITYNHYYTDNIQNARQDSLKKSIQDAMHRVVKEDWNGKFHVSNNQLDSERLLSSLQKRVVVNMDEQACTEALAALAAYYKVAMKTFVDNVCRQVIERHILCNLTEVFSPQVVLGFSDKELFQIAAESTGQRRQREKLTTLVQGLRESLLHISF